MSHTPSDRVNKTLNSSKGIKTDGHAFQYHFITNTNYDKQTGQSCNFTHKRVFLKFEYIYHRWGNFRGKQKIFVGS